MKNLTVGEIINELQKYPNEYIAWGWDDGSIIIADPTGENRGGSIDCMHYDGGDDE